MRTYQIVVTEIRAVTCVYDIEAPSLAEARDKAAIGDTVDEREAPEIAGMEVRDRHVWDD